MDRVDIPGEAPGCATYYMGAGPEEYGSRLYEMERFSGAVIRSAFIDIGLERTEPTQPISSQDEYEDLIWKTKGKSIYSCRFDVTYKDLDVIVIPDFEAKRLTLRVDPGISSEQKTRLAEFFEILTEPDYYEDRKMEELEEELKIPRILQGLVALSAVFLLVTSGLDLAGALSDMVSFKLIGLLQIASALFMAAYWIWIWLKKRQLKKERQERGY